MDGVINGIGELTAPEAALVEAARQGKEYSFLVPGSVQSVAGRSARNSVRAAIIRSLCVGDVGWKTHGKGLLVRDAAIEGVLDLTGVSVGMSLAFENCLFNDRPMLSGAQVVSLSLSGSKVPGLDAERINCSGKVLLDQGFTSTGTVSIAGATVAGLVSLQGSFDGNGSVAISARGLECKGGLFFREGFIGRGEVDLSRAKLGLGLTCKAGQYLNGSGIAFNARGIECGGNVYLEKGLTAHGQVSFARARIAGQLICSGVALSCDRLYALDLEGMLCEEDVYLVDGFQAIGGVSMAGSTVSGQIGCSGASMIARGGDESLRALNAQGLECRGDLFVRSGFRAEGEVNIAGAKISGQLSCAEGSFRGRLVFDGAIIGGELLWRKIQRADEVQVSLSRSHVGTLLIDEQSIPGSLEVNGLTYDGFAPLADHAVQEKWLERAEYDPQPYQELARLLRQHGFRGGATSILVASEKRRLSGVSPMRRLWGWVLSATVGYGYRPSRALIWLLLLLVAGSISFGIAGTLQVMLPVGSKNSATPADFGWLDACFYSLDTLLPVVDLGVGDSWMPGRSSVVVWIYWRIHVVLGWILSTLAVLGFTGIVRPRD